jgi:tRNA (pseudouridine54-N1)-methyltransferase
MRTFVLRARQAPTQLASLSLNMLDRANHLEVILHVMMNVFFISKGFREDAELYIVIDSAPNFPVTIHLSAKQGLSLDGFHEDAMFFLLKKVMSQLSELTFQGKIVIDKGITLMGIGFERLLKEQCGNRSIYFLSPEGEAIHQTNLSIDPVFVLTDHIPFPKKVFKSYLKKPSIYALSLGKTMLFASQCIPIIHYACDEQSI